MVPSSTRVDGVIIGAGRKDHLVANLDACEEGPLDKRKLLAVRHVLTCNLSIPNTLGHTTVIVSMLS